jgi:hypothetical protein
MFEVLRRDGESQLIEARTARPRSGLRNPIVPATLNDPEVETSGPEAFGNSDSRERARSVVGVGCPAQGTPRNQSGLHIRGLQGDA